MFKGKNTWGIMPMIQNYVVERITKVVRKNVPISQSVIVCRRDQVPLCAKIRSEKFAGICRLFYDEKLNAGEVKKSYFSGNKKCITLDVELKRIEVDYKYAKCARNTLRIKRRWWM